MRRGRAAWVAAIAAVLLPTAARAAATPILAVERGPGAEDCPDVGTLTHAVSAIVGPEGVEAAAADLGLEIAITRDGAKLRAIVRSTRAAPGTRELSDDNSTCGGLAPALATTIALLIERHREETRAARAPDPPPTPRPPPAPTPPPPAAPPPRPVPPPAREPWTGWLTGEVTLAPGLLPGISPGLRLGVEGRRAGMTLRVGAFWLPGSSRDYAPGRVDLTLVGGTVGACARFWGTSADPPLAASACVQPLVAALVVRGQGYPEDDSAVRPWLAVEARLELAGRLGTASSWGWGASVGLDAPVQKKRAFVEGLGTAWEPDLVSPALSLVVRRRVW